MEDVLRYILIATIIYVIGMEIYKDIRSRTIDYLLWAIVGLFGIAIWLSRGFLINVELTLIPIAADIAKIESIDLVSKQELIYQKGGKQ